VAVRTLATTITIKTGSRIISVLSPDLYYRSVYEMDLDDLRSRGIDTLLVDLDNTLLARNSSEIPRRTREWADVVRDAGFRVCLVSNNWHARVQGVATDLGFELVAKALKPFPFAFWRALAKTGASSRTCAVVGDQMFTDVLGGKLTGCATVLVEPLSSSDLPHTLLLRKIERVLLAGRQPLS